MSILVVQLVPEGIIFGADRNITAQLKMRDGTEDIIVTGQTQRPKVLKWPNHEVLLGYVGAAEVEGHPTDQWLYAFIGRNLNFPDMGTLAQRLTGELDALFKDGVFDGPLILHLSGFEHVGEEWTPRVYYIRNTVGLRENGLYDMGTGFTSSEELTRPGRYDGMRGSQIRDALRAETYQFRQGYDLGSFGLLDAALHEVMGVIIRQHPLSPHPAPTTVEEWAKHVAFRVHGYGAYFASFYPPFEQYVGGGADVVWARWPS